MNKSELIEAVAGEAGLSKSEAEKAVNALIQVVQGAVSRDDKVTLPGFGSWSRTQRAARTGRNPRTGEAVHVRPKRLAFFKVGKELRERVNDGRGAKRTVPESTPTPAASSGTG